MTQEQISSQKLKPVKLYHHWHAIQIPEFNLDAEKANEWFSENFKKENQGLSEKFNYFSKFLTVQSRSGNRLVLCYTRGIQYGGDFLQLNTGDWILIPPKSIEKLFNANIAVISHDEFVKTFDVETVNMGHIR